MDKMAMSESLCSPMVVLRYEFINFDYEFHYIIYLLGHRPEPRSTPGAFYGHVYSEKTGTCNETGKKDTVYLQQQIT